MSESPLHGFRGDTQTPAPLPKPRGLTVAITREAGGRGSDIASAVGERLGWQVFNQETLDQLVNDAAAYPDYQWQAAGLRREWWIHVQAFGSPFVVGFAAAVAYFAKARPRLVAEEAEKVVT